MPVTKFAKCYFYFSLLLGTIFFVDDISNDELMIDDYLYHAFTFIGVIGLYGYINSTPIGNYHFWKFFIPVSLIVELYTISILDILAQLEELNTFLMYCALFVTIALSLFFIFIHYLFLYRYSNNPIIWLQDNK